MIDAIIRNGLGDKVSAEVTNENAVKVATVDYFTYIMAIYFFSNSEYGIDLNRDFRSSVGELIHDGTDTVAWTGTQTLGTVDFADTNNPFSGTKNISITDSINGELAFFDKGSDFQITDELALNGKVYIDSFIDNKTEIKFAAWDMTLDVKVGDEKKLFDYVDKNILDQWQTFNIPIADLGIAGATFDGLRMKIDKDGLYADLDYIQFTSPSGSNLGTQVFTIVPDDGHQLLVDGFNISIANDGYSGIVVDGTMPSIPYKGFLGVSTLDNGMIFRIVNDIDDVIFILNITDLIQFFNYGQTTFNGYGSDGSDSWLSFYVKFPVPIVLNDSEKDRMELILNDNLSGLDWFRWSANCKERQVF